MRPDESGAYEPSASIIDLIESVPVGMVEKPREPNPSRLRRWRVGWLAELAGILASGAVDDERRRAAGIPTLADIRCELLRREAEGGTDR